MADRAAETEERLSEILNLFSRKIGSTKGALYATPGGKDPYELVTWYGFASTPRRQVSRSDLIVNRLNTRRSAFWVNGASSDPRLYELLFHSGTDSILVVPIYLQNQLVGFFDLRDKAGGEPFGNSDLPHAREIIEQILPLLSRGVVTSSSGNDRTALAAAPPVDEVAAREDVLRRTIQKAHTIADRDLAPHRATTRTLSEAEIMSIVPALSPLLQLSGVSMAVFTAFGHLGNIQQIISRASITDEAMRGFEQKLKNWIRKHWNLKISDTTRSTVTLPFGESGPKVQPAHIGTVLSAAVEVNGIPGLVLSVGFETAPSRQTKAALALNLELVQQMLHYSLSHLRMRTANQKIAERLLEPDFRRYPRLADHSMRVAMLAEQFAQYLDLSAAEMENIRLAAYLHDAGMRLLDYDRLYEKPSFNDDDRRLVREHPVLGAALIAESALGEEIARVVLHHHEQPDGKGYPHGLTGEQIPLGSRILRICETFDAMTSHHSYHEPVPESAALASIVRLAGAEFELDLAHKFNEMLVRASTFGMNT
ncbi:MAG: HD domain-containing phosphohydrolase [Thermoanaerobaculia bacterium]